MNDLFPEMSGQVDMVLGSLMKAKQQIGSVKKDSKNPFHKSNYASLNAYIDASESHLLEQGLILIQAGNGTYQEPMIVATLMHPESGQWIKSYLPILNPKLDSQGLGSSVTYMRRYSIATLLGLVAEDDDGETAVGRGKKNKTQSPEVNIPEEQPLEIPVNPKIEAENLDKLLSMFQEEDRFLVMQYLEVVKKHFSWTQAQCVKKFLEDKSLIDKFTAWKNKRKIA